VSAGIMMITNPNQAKNLKFHKIGLKNVDNFRDHKKSSSLIGGSRVALDDLIGQFDRLISNVKKNIF
jgi:hypothetical protein